MTKQDFMVACADRMIDPSIALEQDGMVEALQDRDDAKVLDILDNEF